MTAPLSLFRFERLAADGAHAEALALLLAMLEAIDRDRGALGGLDLADLACDGSDEDYLLVFSTRMAAAIGRLLTSPALALGPLEYEALLIHHRWIDTIFALSGFRGSDPYLRQMAETAADGGMVFVQHALPRLLAMLSLHAPLARDVEALGQVDLPIATLAFLHYLGARCVFSSGHANLREHLLGWLPSRLGELRLGALSLARLPEIYMHCSYASLATKHAIKAPLIADLRRACLEAGAVEWQSADARGPESSAVGGKPVIVVVAEHLRAGHSVLRTHGRALAGLRARFHVVGVCRDGLVDAVGRALFDEIIRVPGGDMLAAVREAAQAIVALRPALVFHIGVGMVAETIALAALRLAPVQCVSFGHTATTMSPAIDYMLLPEAFVGATACHSEEVVALPWAALPYNPVRPTIPPRPPADGIVRIAIAASAPKLNPGLFHALQRIERAARRPVEFHFLTLGAVGLAHARLVRATRTWFESAVIEPEAPHDVYMERLARCDFFLSPFPYGNMNGLLDAFQLGLPGICLDGAEPHSHADSAILARVGLPPALVAGTVDDYVAAAVRLVDDEAWRAQCRRIVATADLEGAFFTGDVALFAEALARLIATGPPALREKPPSAMVRPVADP